ncbi:hypothetical protein GOODEAATRI_010799 [Goodea atripinnis]|uniref:Uncharacterized protein n=1 Tax=Goodea atripinnis TaxID=208336 RepID=A0ABV0N9K4_9TELE
MMPSVSPHLPVPRPSYSQARENLVRAIPPKLLCMLACGGKDCRYEGPECWKSNQQVIRGLFSSWVTDDIIAMARPSNHLIKKYNIIEQFQRLKIRSIINTQLPGEHAHCGPPLDLESGFTYSPQIFMDNKSESVLIACYLIYTLRISPSEAVHYVRIKRPRSIQTRSQINQVFDFARLLGTQLAQYPDLSLRHGAPFTLQHYLNRQALLLHGQEARRLRHTPKVGTLSLHYINLFMIVHFYLVSQSTCTSFLTPSDQVVYLLCVRLSCLALALASPSEVHAELEKRSAVRVLSRAVRETLVSKQYLPLLTERRKGSWAGSGSVSSWDEPLGFLERKHEVLLDKRSYSESDITKIRVYEKSTYPWPNLDGPRGSQSNGRTRSSRRNRSAEVSSAAGSEHKLLSWTKISNPLQHDQEGQKWNTCIFTSWSTKAATTVPSTRTRLTSGSISTLTEELHLVDLKSSSGTSKLQGKRWEMAEDVGSIPELDQKKYDADEQVKIICLGDSAVGKSK